MPPSIQLSNVSVQFRLPRERLSGLKEYVVRWAQGGVRYEHFWALQDVSLEVQPGEMFGVIGRNGAGKSTLLKVLARVLKPTSGRVILRGRVAPLLELGAGFHPELTGRENVYLNGAMLGRTRREIQDCFESIVAFADIGEFLDAPLRTYSTGMVARLGFAVATSLRPDILLVDEVLSVGDMRFREKCLARMADFQNQGTAIVLVSHSMPQVTEWCQRAIWLEGGRVAAYGPAGDVVVAYQSSRVVE